MSGGILCLVCPIHYTLNSRDHSSSPLSSGRPLGSMWSSIQLADSSVMSWPHPSVVWPGRCPLQRRLLRSTLPVEFRDRWKSHWNGNVAKEDPRPWMDDGRGLKSTAKTVSRCEDFSFLSPASRAKNTTSFPPR